MSPTDRFRPDTEEDEGSEETAEGQYETGFRQLDNMISASANAGSITAETAYSLRSLAKRVDFETAKTAIRQAVAKSLKGRNSRSKT